MHLIALQELIEESIALGHFLARQRATTKEKALSLASGELCQSFPEQAENLSVAVTLRNTSAAEFD